LCRSPARALALAGTYDVTLVADSGPRIGHSAHGTLSLTATDTLHRDYVNVLGGGIWRRHGDRRVFRWGSIRGDVGPLTAGTPIDSRDPRVETSPLRSSRFPANPPQAVRR